MNNEMIIVWNLSTGIVSKWELEFYYLKLHLNITPVSIVTDALINWTEAYHKSRRVWEGRDYSY
jgi:hypothetical protein